MKYSIPSIKYIFLSSLFLQIFNTLYIGFEGDLPLQDNVVNILKESIDNKKIRRGLDAFSEELEQGVIQ